MTDKFIIAVAIVASVIIAPMVYMMADNQPPYDYDGVNSQVIPSQTPAGRQLRVHWVLKRVNRICPGSITRTIVDQKSGTRISYDPAPAATNVELGDTELDRTFLLPPEIPPGKKWYYADAEYACNPLQRFYPLKLRTPRLSFEVVP